MYNTHLNAYIIPEKKIKLKGLKSDINFHEREREEIEVTFYSFMYVFLCLRIVLYIL